MFEARSLTWNEDEAFTTLDASLGPTYTNDILGNRLTKGSTAYGWDDLNRMTSYNLTNNSNSYVYRADGLRVSKTATGSASSQSSSKNRYDGQMGIEDVELNSSSTITAISRFALGGRGIDSISRTTSSGTSVSYPLYDTHGNNVAKLTKSGASWSVGDERTYDAWGGVRSGGTTGTQKGRYCANLGHKQDDESALTYMRARYYESVSGRFVTEDSARHGLNWFSYCNSDPINRIDETGCDYKYTWQGWVQQALAIGFGVVGYALVAVGFLLAISKNPLNLAKASLMLTIGMGLTCIGYGAACTSNWINSFLAAFAGFALGLITTAVFGAKATSGTLAALVGAAVLAYVCLVTKELGDILAEEMRDYTDNVIGG